MGKGIAANTMSSWLGKHQSPNCVTQPPPSSQSTRSTWLEGVIREHFTMLYAMQCAYRRIILNGTYIHKISIWYIYIYASAHQCTHTDTPTSPHPFSCGQVRNLPNLWPQGLAPASLGSASLAAKHLRLGTCQSHEETWEWSEIHGNRPKCKVVP